MKRVKDICLGYIDLLTLKEFISSIAITIHPTLKNGLISFQRTAPSYWGNDGMTTTERRIRAVLYPIKRDITDKDVEQNIFTEQVDKYELDKMLRDMGAKCQCLGGNPNCLVRIAPRTWLMTEPRLYTIHADKDTHGLVSHMPYKSLVWKVRK